MLPTPCGRWKQNDRITLLRQDRSANFTANCRRGIVLTSGMYLGEFTREVEYLDPENPSAGYPRNADRCTTTALESDDCKSAKSLSGV